MGKRERINRMISDLLKRAFLPSGGGGVPPEMMGGMPPPPPGGGGMPPEMMMGGMPPPPGGGGMPPLPPELMSILTAPPSESEEKDKSEGEEAKKPEDVDHLREIVREEIAKALSDRKVLDSEANQLKSEINMIKKLLVIMFKNFGWALPEGISGADLLTETAEKKAAKARLMELFALNQ